MNKMQSKCRIMRDTATNVCYGLQPICKLGPNSLDLVFSDTLGVPVVFSIRPFRVVRGKIYYGYHVRYRGRNFILPQAVPVSRIFSAVWLHVCIWDLWYIGGALKKHYRAACSELLGEITK